MLTKADKKLNKKTTTLCNILLIQKNQNNNNNNNILIYSYDAKINLQHPYSSLQCHIIFQKSF